MQPSAKSNLPVACHLALDWTTVCRHRYVSQGFLHALSHRPSLSCRFFSLSRPPQNGWLRLDVSNQPVQLGFPPPFHSHIRATLHMSRLRLPTAFFTLSSRCEFWCVFFLRNGRACVDWRRSADRSLYSFCAETFWSLVIIQGIFP
jgi:hypothetical protein